MKLDALQTQLVTLLAAAFPNDTVVADFGRESTERIQEKALATRGLCWAVSPLMRAIPVNGSGGRSVALRATVVCQLRTNPDVNASATGAQAEPVEAICDGIAAVLAYATPGNKRFSLAEDGDAVSYVENEDEGLLSWNVRFNFTVQQ